MSKALLTGHSIRLGYVPAPPPNAKSYRGLCSTHLSGVQRQHTVSAPIAANGSEKDPYDSAPGYLIFDRDTTFNAEVTDTAKSFGIEPKRTSFRSPWQNGVAERWVGSCRRELMDHVIVVNDRHLKRLMNEYVRYYHEDRTHITLAKGTPSGRNSATTF